MADPTTTQTAQTAVTTPASGAPPRLTRDQILSPRTQLVLAEKRAQTEMIARLAEMNWGKGLDYPTRKVLASYCRRNALDPREIHILGGNIYRNGKYWLRRLSELVQNESIEWAKVVHIAADPRLEQDANNADLAEDDRVAARTELMYRRKMRQQYAVPEEATAAAVAMVKAKWLTEPVSGCKFVIKGRKKQTRNGPVDADPVGSEYPTETAETRAWRRCLRIIASTNPTLKAIEEELQDDELSAGVELQQIAAESISQDEAPTAHPTPLMRHEGYGEEPTARSAPSGGSASMAVVATSDLPGIIRWIADKRAKGDTLTEDEAEEIRQYELDHGTVGRVSPTAG